MESRDAVIQIVGGNIVYVWTQSMSQEDASKIGELPAVLQVDWSEIKIVAWINPCFSFKETMAEIGALFGENWVIVGEEAK